LNFIYDIEGRIRRALNKIKDYFFKNKRF